MDFILALIILLFLVVLISAMLFHAYQKDKRASIHRSKIKTDEMIESHLLVMELGDVIDQGKNPALDIYVVGMEKKRILDDMYSHYEACGLKESKQESELPQKTY